MNPCHYGCASSLQPADQSSSFVLKPLRGSHQSMLLTRSRNTDTFAARVHWTVGYGAMSDQSHLHVPRRPKQAAEQGRATQYRKTGQHSCTKLKRPAPQELHCCIQSCSGGSSMLHAQGQAWIQVLTSTEPGNIILHATMTASLKFCSCLAQQGSVWLLRSVEDRAMQPLGDHDVRSWR